MYWMSSKWEGIYMCRINHGCSGVFCICIICKYGEISAGVGILVMFPGYAYLLFIRVRSPPLAGVYGILCCMHLVRAWVLLKINLYSGNRFSIYFVDFVAVSLVSCIVMIAGFVVLSVIKLYMFGKVVFKDEAFHVMMCVLWFVICISWFCGNGGFGSWGGCEYSVKGSLYLRDSVSKFSGKNGNLFISIWRVGGVLFCFKKSYNCL